MDLSVFSDVRISQCDPIHHAIRNLLMETSNTNWASRACRSLPSIRQRRSGKPCGCGCRAPLFQSTRSIWSSSAMTCSPKSGSVSPSRSTAGEADPSTRSGPTGGCSCAPATRSRTAPGTDSTWCSPPTMPPEAAGRVAGQRAAPDAAGHRVPRRRSGCKRPPASTGRKGCSAGNKPALAHDLSVVERKRSPHCHRRDNGESGSQQHRDQAHQKDWPGIHQRRELQNAYPVAQCRQNSGMNIPPGSTFTTNREEPARRFGAGSAVGLQHILGHPCVARGFAHQRC